MKSRAESLDASLDQLRSSFESITQLAASLGAGDPALRAARPAVSQPPTGPADPPSESSASTVVFDPLVHLPPIVNLPSRLRACLSEVTDGKRGRAEADQLWGAWVEPLRIWEDAGVVGARDIAAECREVLARARRPSVSSPSAAVK